MTRSERTLATATLAALLLLGAGGCGPSDLAGGIPVPIDAGADADAGSDIDAGDGGPDAGDGKPCAGDSDCNDGIDCSTDSCDLSVGRCRHDLVDALCDDMRYCDGVEVCDATRGCVAGPAVTCSDQDVCTFDACVEETRACVHTPRDADQDGDPDAHCGGTDCNDQDPTISGKTPEVCGNGVDDNCDGMVDEMPCVAAPYDDCLSPLPVTAPGAYLLSTVGAHADLAASCGPGNASTSRDVVASVTIPPGPPVRLDARITVPQGTAAVAIGLQCGVPSTELSCGESAYSSQGVETARARAWSLPPGIHPIVMFTDHDTQVTLDLSVSDAGAAPTNETCGTAADLAPSSSVLVPLVGAEADVPTSCNGTAADLVYRIHLTAPQDVRIFASSVDGQANAVLSLRDAACAKKTSEVACRADDPVELFARSLAPGDHFLAVSASSPDDVSLLLTLEPPTSPPADETCKGSPLLSPNQRRQIDLADHQTDVPLCGNDLLDAAYDLELSAWSDVLALLKRPSGDQAALSIDTPACATATDVVVCASQSPYPLRAAATLPAGSYRVVAGLSAPHPAELTTFVRPAFATQAIPGADTCDAAVAIPETGGLFTGDTSAAAADWPSGCDQGGVPGNGAPDQILRLDLTARRRVVFDMAGSSYSTLLDVRKGPACPGEEMDLSCTIGTSAGRSFLDLTLDAGTYFLQIDGYSGASGPWALAVFVGDPG